MRVGTAPGSAASEQAPALPYAAGLRGLPGPPGPPGPQGAASDGAFYEHIQGVATNVWPITHSLGYHPNVAVFDSTGTEVEGGNVVHHSNSSLTITFAYNFSGVAYLS